MPRQPDPDLEERIVNAAHRLWRRGGTKALTMRAVAKAAGTNTPAVYRRFKNRQDLLRALLQRVRREVVDLLRTARTVEEAGERYLDFALSHPREYELFHLHEYELFHSLRAGRALSEARPGLDAMKAKLAERLGGEPDDHTRLAMALWALAHGTAMLLISKTIPPESTPALRSVFTASVEILIRASAGFSVKR
jgi:AcrR family transcriptional regulator